MQPVGMQPNMWGQPQQQQLQGPFGQVSQLEGVHLDENFSVHCYSFLSAECSLALAMYILQHRTHKDSCTSSILTFN